MITSVRADFKEKLHLQPIVADLREALTELRERGNALHVVSSNSAENISAFLSRHGIREAFTDITSFFTIFGKAHGIGKLLKKLRCAPESAVYIGDETRDIEAAQKVGIKSLAVTWGYNTERALLPYKPYYVARKPSDLVGILCDTSHRCGSASRN